MQRDNRLDEIGQALSQDEECMKLFNAVIEIQEALRAKLSSGDSELLDRLEEAYVALAGTMEQRYYLAGLQDRSISNKIRIDGHRQTNTASYYRKGKGTSHARQDS
jgi:hypothetical protein